MTYLKSGSAFLYDDATGDVVGLKDADGSERIFMVSGGVVDSATLQTWGLSQAFRLVSATRDSNGAITTASIVWPDGVTGTYTADTLSTEFPGATDAWHATYASTPTKTITQPAVTRDENGAVTVQPAITIT